MIIEYARTPFLRKGGSRALHQKLWKKYSGEGRCLTLDVTVV